MDNILKNLKELEIEDLIWIITLFTASFAIVSNKLERDYLFTGDLTKQKKFKTINITLLSIAFFIYLYFVLLAYSRIKMNNPNTSFKQMRIREANFIAAVLVLLATLIYLVTSILSDDNTDIDLLA